MRLSCFFFIFLDFALSCTCFCLRLLGAVFCELANECIHTYMSAYLQYWDLRSSGMLQKTASCSHVTNSQNKHPTTVNKHPTTVNKHPTTNSQQTIPTGPTHLAVVCPNIWRNTRTICECEPSASCNVCTRVCGVCDVCVCVSDWPTNWLTN
jgi:hypothetical protein